MISVLFLLLAVQDPILPAAAAPAAPEVDVTVETAAAAILPVVRVRPVSGYSEAGLAAGHTGSVVVEVDVQPDGTRGEAEIAVSSRSELLDAEAVRMITEATLRPPAAASRYRIEVKFDPFNILEMRCSDFARQARWFAAAWPEKSVRDTTLYTASVGAMTIVAMDGGSLGAQAALRPAREMEGYWPRLITECERQPNRPYLQVLARLMG